MPLQKLLNFSVDTNFRIYCPELPILSEVAQDVTIPALTLPPTEVYTRFVDYNQPGEKIQYTEIDIGFSMDEYYDVYAEVYSWMHRMAGPPGESHIEEENRRVVFCDTEVILLDNNQKQGRKFVFTDSWPTSMGAISLDAAGDATVNKGVLTLDFSTMILAPDTKNLTQLGDVKYNH